MKEVRTLDMLPLFPSQVKKITLEKLALSTEGSFSGYKTPEEWAICTLQHQLSSFPIHDKMNELLGASELHIEK